MEVQKRVRKELILFSFTYVMQPAVTFDAVSTTLDPLATKFISRDICDVQVKALGKL
jgi:hypothetical protein